MNRTDLVMARERPRVCSGSAKEDRMPEKKRQKKAGMDKGKKNQAKRRRRPSNGARGGAREKEMST